MDLPESSLGVRVENDFEPEFVPLKKSIKTFDRFSKLAISHNELILAMDPDREGEAISFHLQNFFKKKIKNIKRIRFREVTKQAILSALASPGIIGTNIVESQFARRILDRLVGYMISPILWKKIRSGLSAGRVQSVVLKWICEREEEISTFRPEEYWDIDALTQSSSGDPVRLSLAKISGQVAEIKTRDAVNRILSDFHMSVEIVKGKNIFAPDGSLDMSGDTHRIPEKPVFLEVVAVKRINKKRYPPLPFITASLQQEAGFKLGFPTKKTMKIAQDLYEGIDLGGSEKRSGIITYMRTDSTRISSFASSAAEKYIRKNFGSEFARKTGTEPKKKAGAQDAHEAIRPTDISLSPESVKKYLTKDQALLYRLIWKRFIASQMSPEEGINTSIVADYQKYSFTASSRKVNFPGFTILDEKPAAERKENSPFSEISNGEKLLLKELLPVQKFTEPPVRYTESGIVRKLEKTGIGRPSTYSPTIEILLKRKYVAKEKKNFYPLSIGIAVNAEMKESFGYLIDDSFTSLMEKKLDSIADGKLTRLAMLKEFYENFSDHVSKSHKKKKVGVSENATQKTVSRKTCPVCQKGEVIRKATRKGKIYYMCNRFPQCEFNSYEDPFISDPR